MQRRFLRPFPPALRAAALLLAMVVCRVPIARGAPSNDDATTFGAALVAGDRALADGKLDEAHHQVERALERDAKSPKAWDLRARWAAAAKDADEEGYALHRLHALLVAQKAPPAEVKAARERLDAADPIAREVLNLDKVFLERLVALAKEYEKSKRPHAAIRVYREALALAPDRADLADAIQRIASAPDPSLAGSAKAKDLLADVSEEWVRRHDLDHKTWPLRAKLERENYVTESDAGYAVLVRCAEAMEQMNAFYRRFFRYGTEADGKSVPKIALHLFRTHDEYLKLGKGPPVDWSGGQFTGDSVETSADGGFDGMVGTLFHEAAHQFVALATTAAGWMNEGLASYFEGSRILANGTVITNLPANHRLFALVEKMERGWMTSASDGIDPAAPSKSDPPKAATFRIVLENEYAWGPPWYAPTWGVVYFLWNCQDEADGRFVYRDAFRQYVNASGGKVGKTAIKTFEDVVLAHPQAATKGVAEAKANKAKLPKTVDDVDDVWKAWLVALRDEQIGRRKVERPYLAWARYALTRKDYDDAVEHFEKGLERDPNDPDLLLEFAEALVAHDRNKDRACKLAEQALRVLEAAASPDAKRLASVESRLSEWDTKRSTLEKTHQELWGAALAIARRYAESKHPLLTMHVASVFGGDLGVPGLDALYEDAVRTSGKSLALWQLAYDEHSLSGWVPGAASVLEPYGTLLRVNGGKYVPESFGFQLAEVDAATSGDFSLEATVRAEKGKNAFAGLVFGRKSASSFHALVFFPEGTVDLASFVGAGTPKIWRENPVAATADPWRKLRIDVAGASVDVWIDGQFVASQDFGDPDVLRGGYGIVTGLGESEFRDVRTLSRAKSDPGARIERAIRIERTKSAGKAVNGSWIGLAPPFPVVETWFAGARTRYGERGLGPTLLVLWSRRSNDAIALHDWLADLMHRHEPAGLDVISISENGAADAVRAYLEAHPFPGAVGLDGYERGKDAVGGTFDAFFIGKPFLLPRLLLLDVDGRVVWEGGPGFPIGVPWKSGDESLLDVPLGELLSRRQIVAARAWLATWGTATGRTAVGAGALDATVGKCLADVRSLPGDLGPEFAWAQARAKSIDDALATFDKTADAIIAAGAEPAVAELAAWGGFVGKAPDPTKVRDVRKAAASANVAAWKSALALCEKAKAELAGGAAAATADALGAKLQKFSGRFPKALRERLVACAGDAVAIARELAEAARMPARWLASDFLHL